MINKYSSISDAQLVKDALAQRREAYEELARRWSSRVLAVCQARTGRRDIAEELTQEALVRGFEKLESLSDPAKFGSWIKSIANRASIDWLRKRKISTRSFSEISATQDIDLPQPTESVIETLEQREEMERVLTAIHELPEKCREVLLLFYYGEHSYNELAELLNTSTATVNARLTKARTLLRQKLLNQESKS